MQDMCFQIGGASDLSFRFRFLLANADGAQEEYKLTPDAQTWPRSQNENLGVPKDAICLIFTSMGQMENKGLDFISKNFPSSFFESN
jgi:hypothetical protein